MEQPVTYQTAQSLPEMLIASGVEYVSMTRGEYDLLEQRAGLAKRAMAIICDNLGKDIWGVLMEARRLGVIE